MLESGFVTDTVRWGNKPQFSLSLYSLGRQSVLEYGDGNEHLHCCDIGRTPYMRLLVLGTPGFDDVANVGALILYLCVVAHGGKKG
jgi:hypothetical protein